MTTNNQNIIINPDVGQPSGNAVIQFLGGNATVGPYAMNLFVYPTSNGTLSFENATYPLVQIANVGAAVLTVNGVASASSFVSTVATGTAPFTVTSTTQVNNLNAQYLGGQPLSYVTNVSNLNGTILAAQMPAFSGDASSSAGTTNLTLATVNSNTGTWGSATQVAQLTVNAKGLITAVSNVTVTPAWTSITGKPTTVSGYGITDAANTAASNVTFTGNIALSYTYATLGVGTTVSPNVWIEAYGPIRADRTGTGQYLQMSGGDGNGLYLIANSNVGAEKPLTIINQVSNGNTVANNQIILQIGTIKGWMMANTGMAGFYTDNAYDIGTSSLYRPRNIYAGTSITTPALTVNGATIAAGTSGHVLPYLDGTNTWSGQQTFDNVLNITYGNSTSNFQLLNINPTNLSVGNPGFFVQKAPVATTWNIGIWDGSSNTGKIDIRATSFTHMSNTIMNTTTAVASSQMPALTGDVTTAAGSVATTLATVNSTPGTFGSATQSVQLTVNAKGLVTAASNVAITPDWSTITSIPAGVTSLAGLTGAGVVTATGTGSLSMVYIGAANSTDIPNLASADTRYVQLGGSTMSGPLVLSGDPTIALGAATKQYVDNNAQGLVTHQAVQVATAGSNITLSGLQTIDGYTTLAGDRVLVKDQTDQTTNGVYVAAAGAWAYASDFNTWAQYPNAYVFVQHGSVNGSSGWTCNVSKTGTLGTTAITWMQFSSSASYTGANGVTVVGQVIQLTGQALTLQNFAQTGLMAYQGSGAFSGVQLVAPAQGFTIANATGVGGNPTFALANDLAALENLSTTGYAKRTGTSTWTAAAIPDSDLPVTLTGHTLTNSTVTGTTSFSGTVNTSVPIVSTVATGTAPFTVASNTIVSNLNAQFFNGQQASYYQSATNLNAGTLSAARLPAFSGDASSTAGTSTLTLATVNSNVGTFGNTTQVAQLTVNAKGLITAVANVTLTPAWSSITGKPTTLAGYGITDAVSATSPNFTNDLLVPQGTAAAPAIGFGSATTGLFSSGLNTAVDVSIAGTDVAQFTTGGINTLGLALGATTSAPDVILVRDAAGTLALRNSTNAQTLRVYNTYGDAADYEVGTFGWTTTANTLTIGATANGTGTQRNVAFVGGGFTFSNPISISGGSQANCPLSFGTPNTGIWGQTGSEITIVAAGTKSAVFDGSGIFSGNNYGAKFINGAASGTSPTIAPSQQNVNSGLGASAIGNVTVISNSVNVLDISNAAVTLSAPLLTTGALTTSAQIVSTVATGTAPFSVASQTLVSNLNAQYLNGNPYTYYLNATNVYTGTLADARLPTALSGKATLQFTAADASGIAFWGGTTATNGIGMSLVGDATYGGQLDTVSDYNIYYRISGGTNRGHAFVGTNGLVAQITGSGQLYLSPTSAGSAPFVLNANATGLVANLNAQYLNGLQSSAFVQTSGAAFTGAISSTGAITSTAVGEAFGLQAGTGTNNSYLAMSNSSGVLRWTLGIDGDGTSQFQLQRYNTSGVLVDTPLSVSPSDGSLTFRLPNGTWINSADGINRLNFTAAGRSYYKSGDGTHEWRNSSDVAKMNLDASGNLVLQGGLTIGSANSLTIGTTASISSTQGGKIVLANAAASNFTALQLGGTTSSYPALYVSGSTLRLRAADNSADAAFSVGAITSSGVLTLPNGSVTAPSMNFGDATTGLYRYGANQVGIAAAGAPVVIADSTGIWIANSAGPMLVNEATSGANPSLIPNRTNTNSGVGASVTGNVTVIANAVNVIDVSNTAVTVSVPLSTTGLTIGGVAAMTTSTGVQASQMPAFSGDVSSSAGSTVLTLATVNTSGAGSYGNATAVPALVVDANGRITSVSNVIVTPAWASITNKPTTVSGFGITDAMTTSTTLQASQMPALTGDVTTTAGTTATTLATVNGNPNTFGNAITIPQITVNAKGLVTTVANVTVNPTQLNSQPASYYTNASNLNAGTVPAARMPALTGDVTTTAGTTATTLATVNGNPNTFGNAITIPQITVNAKGLVTSVSNVTVNPTQLNSQPASYYTNASNLNAGIVPAAQMPALTGDVTTSAGSTATTLASVNASGAGTYGDSTHVPQIVVDAKGRITSVSNVAIPTSGTLSGNNTWTGMNTFQANTNISGAGLQLGILGAGANIKLDYNQNNNPSYLYQGNGNGLNLAVGYYQNTAGMTIAGATSGGGIGVGSNFTFGVFSNATIGQAPTISNILTLNNSGQMTINGLAADSQLILNSPSGHQSDIFFASGGTNVWQLGMQSDASTFYLYDDSRSAYAFSVTKGGGNFVFNNPVQLLSSQYTGGTPNTIGAPVGYATMNGGRTWTAFDLTSQPNLYETRFVNMGSSTNVPSGMSGNGYWFGMGAGDGTPRGFSLMGTEGSGTWYKCHNGGSWTQLLDTSHAYTVTGQWTFNSGTGVMYFQASGTTKMSMNTDGMHFNDWMRIDSASTGLYWSQYGGGWQMTDTTWLRAYSDKNIMTGGAVQMGSFTVTSDRRLKTDIVELTGSAEIIDRTNVYEFTKRGKRHWGVLAQEVQEVAPILVEEGASLAEDEGEMKAGECPLTVDLTGYIPHLIAEVRALRARVAELEARK